MVDIRMPDGTVIQGVPDGVSKSELEQKLISNYGRSRFYKMIGREEAVDEPWMNPTDHDEHIKSASAKYNIPEARLRRQIWQESKFDPQATSEAGAQGLMQIMPVTQQELGITDPYDPAESVDKGAAYMRKLLDRFDNDYDKALAAYHSGARRVQKLVDRWGDDWHKHLGPVGRKYVDTQRQDFMYSAAAQKKPEDEQQEIQEPAAQTGLTEKQMRDRAVLNESLLSDKMPGAKKKSGEDALEEQGSLIRRLTDLGIYDPSSYYMTQDEIDAITTDQVQEYADHRNAMAEQASVEGRAMEPEEENPDKGWWNFTKAVFANKGTQILTGLTLKGRDTDIIRQQNIQIGQLYLERLNQQYTDLGENGQEIVDEAAAKHGMTPEQFAAYTANQVDLISKDAIGDVKLINSIQEEINAVRPEGNWATNIASMVIENTPQLASIGAGIATGNPMVTMALMGSDVYANTYATARASGRDAAGAAQDAFAATAIEIGTEGIAVDRFIKALKAGNRSKARRMFEGVLTEGAQEVLAEAGQIAYDVGILEEDMTWGEAFARMRDAGVVGMVIGGGISVPMTAVMNNDLANAQDRYAEAQKNIRSVAARMQNPNERITKAEVDKARQDLADAHKAIVKITAESEAKALEKKKAKAEKKEAKQVKKMTPVERKRYEARKEAAALAEAGKLKVEAPTEEDLKLTDLIERAANRDISEKDAPAVEQLLDKGLAKVDARGNLIILKSGQDWAKSVRDAEKAAAPAETKDEVIQPVPFKRKEHVTPPPEGRDVEIKVKPFKSQQRRKAELVARVTASVTDEEARNKIADAILRAEQEDAAYAQKEAEDAKKQAKLDKQKLDKDYDLAIRQVRAEEADVAEGLIAMDEKRISGYQGTRLGDVLRNAMNVLEKAEAKAKEQLKDALWNKPVQGELFDITGVVVRGTRDYANLVKVGALKLAKIGLKYGAWTADMVGEYGDSIRPALAQIYSDAKKKVRDVMRISHEKFKSGERAGELKYAPTQYAKPGQIRKLRRTLEKLAKEGERGRFWYEKTGKEVLKITGGNMEEARKLAGLLAIYSSGTAVGANLTNALKMWSDFKGNSLRMPKSGTKAGRFTEQDQTAIAWLKSDQTDEHFVESFGPKRYPFFTNIMREIDPTNYEADQGATVDLWMMRAMGYDTVAPTDPQNAFAATEIQNIAEKMGWEKQQAQAAIWVAIKARWEYIQTVAKNRAVKEGLAEWVVSGKGKPTFEVVGASREDQIANEKAIINIFRDEALKVSLAEVNEKLDQSAQDFADYMGRHYGVISWEAEPSSKLGLAFNKMPLEAKIAMQAEIAQILTNPETGRELIAEWLGLLGQNQFIGPGAWEMNIGSATQNSVILPQKHKMDGPEVNEKASQAMDGYAMIMGFLLMQDAVAWHRPFYATAQYRANGVEVIAKTLTHGETKRLYEEIVDVAVRDGIPLQTASEWAPIVLDGAFRVLNFTGVDNKRFHKIIQKAADNVGVDGTMELFASVGNLVSNNWEANPNGEQYEHQISKSKNSAVQKAFARAQRELAPKIEAVRKKYARQYAASPSEAAVVVPAGKETKKPKKGYLRFRHFSTAKPDALKVEYSGTGIKGEERSRSPSTQIDVISAYPDEGFTKEVGLGPNEYVIDVREQDMYNLSEDPLNLYGYGKDPQTFNADMKPIGFRTDHHKVEQAIRDAGYLGYYVPKASGNMKGQARFFRDLPVNRKTTAMDETFSMSVNDTVDVRENDYDEFEVTERNGEIYYTSDLEDAIDTARQIYGSHIDVNIFDADGTFVDVDRADKRAPRIKLRNLTKKEIQTAHEEFMEEFFEATMHNPLSPDERIWEYKAKITMRPSGDVMWLDWLNAIDIGTGAGSEALDFIVEMADRHGVTLKLIAQSMNELFPSRTHGLPQDILEQFYMSRGFVQENGQQFVRLPQGPSTASYSFTPGANIDQIGMPADIVRAEVTAIAKELGLPREMFVVVQKVSGLPADLAEKIAIWGGAASVNGVYRYEIGKGPRIYIISQNLYNPNTLRTSRSDMIQTIIHETLGHFGLQALLTPKQYIKFMDMIRKAYPEEVAWRGRDMSKSDEGRRLAAEEVFAYMAQEILENKAYRTSKRGVIEKVIDAVRLALAKIGLRKLDDADLIAMMQRVAEHTKKKNPNILRKRATLQAKMREARIAAEKAGGNWTEPAGENYIEGKKKRPKRPSEAQMSLADPDRKMELEFRKRSGGYTPGIEVVKNPDTGLLEFIDDMMNDDIRELGWDLGYDGDMYLSSVAKFSVEIEMAMAANMSGTAKSYANAQSSIDEAFSIGLERERKNDPDLDRFMTKIGHGHHKSFTNLRDWWYTFRNTWREATEREIFDQFASIKRREQELGIFGEQSGYMSVRLSAGVDVMIRAAIEHGVPVWRDGWAAINENEMSLLDVLAPVSQSAEMLKAFEAWLVANRSRRLSKEQREKLLSRDEIASAIRFIRKKKLYHLFKQTASDLAAYKKSVLDFAEEAGIINKDTRPLWENSDHVPFYRVLTQNDKVGPFAASRIGHVKNPIRRLTGGTAPLKPPLDSIVQNLSMLIEAAVKNKAMTDVVKNFDGSGIITKAPQAELSSALIPLQQIQDRLDEAGVSIDAVGRAMLTGIQKLTSLQAPTDDNVVSILENGKKQYYYVHDTGIMRGLEGVTPKQWSALMRVLRAPKRWLTWSITRMPDFILKNWFRDVWHAFVLGRHGTIMPGYDSVRGWAKAIREDETFRDMMAGGGVFHAGYVNAVDPKGTHTAIRAMVLGKGRHGVLDTPRKIWEFYKRIADGAENAHRVAVYEKALKKTGSRKVALFESRDLMDFSVRGRHGIIRFLAETVPFWSARVQGLQRTGKGFAENPRLTFARALPITIATIMLYALNKDDERYKALNPYDKRMYYHFFDVFNAGDHWRLPKPFEIGAIFSTLPEIFTEYVLSQEPDRSDELLQSIVWTAGEMLSLYPEVQMAMPFYELMMNKNTFTEAPILNLRDQNLPPEGQYSDRTNPTIKEIAEAMPDFAPEFARSPKQLEHLIRGYFGSLVDYVAVMSDELVYLSDPSIPPRPARRLDETPFVKSFARENQEKYDIYLTSLYDVVDEADKIYYRVKQLKDEGRREEATALSREEEALLFARQRMSPAEKRIKTINTQIARVRAHPKMTPTQKADKLNDLYRRRSEAAKRVYEYRPGGKKSKGAEPVESIWDTVMEAITGKPKKEQVDELISQNLPRTAVLVNDMQISDDKLREFA